MKTFFILAILFGSGTESLAQLSQRSDQDTTTQSVILDAPVVSFQTIDDVVSQISADSNLDDHQQTDLKQRLQRAKQALTNAETLASKTASLKEQSAVVVADQISQTQLDLEQTEPQAMGSRTDLSAERFSSQIADAEGQLVAATQRSQELAVEPTRRQTRLNEIPDQLAKANDELESVRKLQGQVDAPNESTITTNVRNLWLAAREQELQQTTEMLKQERVAYMSTVQLLPLQQQLAEKTVARLRAKLEALKKAQTEQNREQAADTVRTTQPLIDRVPNALKELAKSNVELAEFQRRLVIESTQVTRNRTEFETAKDLVVKELATSIQRVDAVGLTDALGAMFRERRDAFQELANRFLPNFAIREKIEAYQTEVLRMEDDIRHIERTLAEREAP